MGNFGFIDGETRKDIFVAGAHVLAPGRTLNYGERVEYDLVEGPKGFEARNVKLVVRISEPIPDQINLELPAKMKLSKVEFGILAKDAGGEATEIRVCLAD